jgi:hypothetical protein
MAKRKRRIRAAASAYATLRLAFEQAFPFMLNRLADSIEGCPDWHAREGEAAVCQAEDRCFNELCNALDGLGVELVEDRPSFKGRN